VKAQRLISLVAAGLIFGGAWSARGQQDFAPGATLSALTADLERLNGKISEGLVRVNVTESAASVLDSVMLKADFEQWVKTNGNSIDADRNSGGRGRGGGGGPPGPGAPGGFGGRGPDRSGGPVNLASQVRTFLMIQADQQDKAGRTTEAAQLRGLALRVEINRGVFQGDMSAMMLDDNGHALLLTGLLREAHTGSAKPIDVTLPDGSKTTASFVGSNLTNNYSVIKLDKSNGAKRLRFASKKIVPGQLLVSRSVGPGAAALVMASGRPGETFSEDRLILATEDRSGTVMFNIDGEMTSVVTSGGVFGPERFALSASRLQREINFMIRDGKDIEPRELGVQFAKPGESQSSTTTNPGRRRVMELRITDVKAKSLADAAGLKKGDVIESIDGQPVSELVNEQGLGFPRLRELQTDFATRTDDVPLEIVRDGKDVKLTMPLK